MKKFRPKNYINKKYGPEVAERIVRMRALQLNQTEIRSIINKGATVSVTAKHIANVLMVHRKDVLEIAKASSYTDLRKKQKKKVYPKKITEKIVNMSADGYSVASIRRALIEEDDAQVSHTYIYDVRKSRKKEIKEIAESRGIFSEKNYDKRRHNGEERRWRHVDGLLPPEEDRDYTTLEGIEKLRTSGLRDLQDIGGDY